MKKSLTIILLCLSLTNYSKAQPILSGIALRNFAGYKTGDTVRLEGYSYDRSSNKNYYILQSQSGEVYIPVSWIQLPEDNIGFWTMVWFQNRAYAIYTKGWQSRSRDILYNDFNNYITRIQEHDLIFEDNYLQEYILYLVGIIHPECLIRPESRSLEIIILKASEPEIYSFNHGAIVITTGKLAELECEEDLAFLLAEHIAHIVLEDNLANYNKFESTRAAAGIASVLFSLGSNVAMGIHNIRSDYDFSADDMLSVWNLAFSLSDILIQPPQDIYTIQQVNRTQKIARRRMDMLMKKDFTFHTPTDFVIIMSPFMKDLAWEKYFQKDYNGSLKLIDRLIQYGIADEEDYLLKTKIYLAQFNSHETNLQALKLVETAEQMDQYKYVELQLQKGIILMRLERFEEAQEALLDYLSVAESYGEDPGRINEAKNLLSQIDEITGAH
ncbi:MAG: hypothetical protein AMS27_04220 [Bacteroides sp. SM23_62_1]|nr:MAG: hypothetical protein AMS27_04220 [Bacteroides sp. SM23_62_1]